MSVLILVRHGQASLFAENYDCLSAIGEQQARLLGEYWSRQGTVINDVVTGPRSRQHRTAMLAGESYRRAGFQWPEVSDSDDLDEYDLEGLSNRLAPELAEQNPDFAQLWKSLRRCEDEIERVRLFQRMFEAVVTHWQSLADPDPDIESWPEFRARVRRQIECLQRNIGRGKRVVAFTSGGFIAGAVQHALGVDDRTMRELNWRIRNCSLTEFVFTPDRFTLDSFNAIPHLTDAAHWTYR